ncbi:MAG: tRNA 2-thiouridine(34) synthase MnmA [Clostridium sp.]|nr:tRNA 2-thiouridine(34) synthase MnmA [Clostridium sp.]MCM1546838.1 tRNA 2-thiouridine(34) synthase MnmA [Ruminococcus sp.]
MDKVMVGMSGGVDSSVAAKLLIDSGYEVVGATLRLFDRDLLSDKTGMCGSVSDVDDAKSVCEKLGIEHFVFDMKYDFRKYVMDKFAHSYLIGETPNPCIECNRHIKFGKMLKIAEEYGCGYIATGHYAVREFDEETGKYVLKRPKDRSKDQTYVLYSLTQHQLSKTLFPLGAYEKSEIRDIAEKAGFINSHKSDSQDICFVPDGDYASFIKKHTGSKIPEGDFVNISGEVIGKHKGIINYTVGQRRGIGISLGRPSYVTDKNALLNTVTIGDEADLYKSEIHVENVNLISMDALENKTHVTAKVRYSKNEMSAVISPDGNGGVNVYFEKTQRAPAKGQAAVFYDGDTVIGGGTIR